MFLKSESSFLIIIREHSWILYFVLLCYSDIKNTKYIDFTVVKNNSQGIKFYQKLTEFQREIEIGS